jgi:aspartate aminotransferase
MTKDLAQVLAQRVERIKPSFTITFAALAEELKAEGKPIINLTIGEPDFDTPKSIKAAAIKAINEGHTKYTPVDGIKSLKKAISNKFKQDNQLHYDLNQILVSSGAKQSLANLFSAILNPGDEVIIPAPYWVSYPDIVKLADGNPVILKTDYSSHFKITPAQLSRAITPNTRAIIINSPSNPSGMSYTAEELEALAEVLLRHPGIIIASDDIYEKNIWDNEPFVNIVNVCPALYGRAVVINGVSKTYAMTGWRIGYAAGPAKIIAAMKKVQSQTTSNPCSISQYAALAALEGNQSCVAKMTKSYKERHDYFVGELQKIPGVTCLPSDGTFYSFPYMGELLTRLNLQTDLDLAEYLLNKADIATIPGSAFGAPGYIRFCYTTSMENLKETIKRMRHLLT